MRTITGTVLSNKMTRTIVVRVDQLRQHPKYLKFYRVSRKYKAHAEDAKAYVPGDVVKIQEARPYSKEKRWKVIEVLKHAAVIDSADTILEVEAVEPVSDKNL